MYREKNLSLDFSHIMPLTETREHTADLQKYIDDSNMEDRLLRLSQFTYNIPTTTNLIPVIPNQNNQVPIPITPEVNEQLLTIHNYDGVSKMSDILRPVVDESLRPRIGSLHTGPTHSKHPK